MLESVVVQSPLGSLEITGSKDGVRAIQFVGDAEISDNCPASLLEYKQQLDEYFNNKRREFSVKLSPDGTDFQKKVWNQLLNIPFGTIVSYLDVAKSLGDKNLVRAVGHANSKNPLPMFIPCHRVIGSTGKSVGYAGGIHRKEWLLKFEADHNLGGLFKK